jgi:hypothetical protein
VLPPRGSALVAPMQRLQVGPGVRSLQCMPLCGASFVHAELCFLQKKSSWQGTTRKLSQPAPCGSPTRCICSGCRRSIRGGFFALALGRQRRRVSHDHLVQRGGQCRALRHVRGAGSAWILAGRDQYGTLRRNAAQAPRGCWSGLSESDPLAGRRQRSAAVRQASCSVWTGPPPKRGHRDAGRVRQIF